MKILNERMEKRQVLYFQAKVVKMETEKQREPKKKKKETYGRNIRTHKSAAI